MKHPYFNTNMDSQHRMEGQNMPIKLIFSFFITLCIFFPPSTAGASSPMVERHLFSPEPDTKGTYKSPLAARLEKELMFTGIIISSHGKWAMIREKGGKADREGSGLHKEGDEIKGLLIQQIGNNFLILAGDGKEVRLNLYHEGKPRPEKPVGAETSSMSEVKSPVSTPPASSETRAGTSADKRKSSFSQGSKRSMPRPGKKADDGPPTRSPFPDTMPGIQSQDSPFPPDTPPFPQGSPPNPFLQEMPPNPFLGQIPDAGGK